jgi:hypothetical protein
MTRREWLGWTQELEPSIKWRREPLLSTPQRSPTLKQRGIDFLDAPVVGSRPQADAAQLIQLIGGDKSVLARAEPVFNRPVGFMGLNGEHMDSLFIDPAWRGARLGRALVEQH